MTTLFSNIKLNDVKWCGKTNIKIKRLTLAHSKVYQYNIMSVSKTLAPFLFLCELLLCGLIWVKIPKLVFVEWSISQFLKVKLSLSQNITNIVFYVYENYLIDSNIWSLTWSSQNQKTQEFKHLHAASLIKF